jgi:translation initiation factor IF-1
MDDLAQGSEPLDFMQIRPGDQVLVELALLPQIYL